MRKTLTNILGLCLIAADLGTAWGLQSKGQALQEVYSEANRAFEEGKFALAQQKLDILLRRQADLPEALNLLGVVCDKVGKPQDSERNFRRAIELKPDYVEARKNLSLHLAKQGKIGGAITELTAALKLQPTDLEAHYLLGRLYFLNNDSEKALFHLSESTKDPRFQTGELFSMLSAVELRAGQLSRAQEHIIEARRRGVVDAKIQLDLGEAFEKQGDIAKARALYEMVVKTRPEMDLGHALLARCYQNAGQFDRAVEHYEKALQLNPASQNYAFALAFTYFQVQRYEDTTRILEHRSDLEEESDYFNLIGSSYAKLGRTVEAGAALEKAIRLHPKDILAYYNLGLVLLEGRSYEQAVRAFEQALVLFPQSEKLLTALGFTHQIRGDSSSARSVFRRMAELSPLEGAPHFYLASSFLETGEDKEALLALTRAKDRNPKDHRIFYLMGLIYYNQGQFSKAFDVFQTSLQLDPSFVFSYQQLAKISLKNGDIDSALKFALKAVELDSTFSQPHYLLGQIYLRLHKSEDANREIEQFQKLQVNSPIQEYRVFSLSPIFSNVPDRSR